MNKNIQIPLLVIVFVVCGACGFFLGNVLFAEPAKVVEPEPEPMVVEEPVIVLSTIPVIDTVSTPVGKGGRYNFSVIASVESGDELIYGLYRDELCTENVDANFDGNFIDVAGTDSKIYYVKVENTKTRESSEIVSVGGFVKLVKVQKVTKDDLEQLFNVAKSWSAATPKILAGVPTNVQIKVLNQEIEKKRSVNDICMQIESGVWSSVTVLQESLVYDAQDKLIKMTVSVNR